MLIWHTNSDIRRDNDFRFFIVPYFKKGNSIILTNTSFSQIMINDILEFFDIFIPASAIKPMLSLAPPMQFSIFGRRHQVLIHSRKEGDI
ncbi:unnamed protein product [Rhizophagus irregularis]|nr:unnamed protein product [Rhizophagus irregularis]CAB4430179.1 unnamed protein product [Rhizophagus irregularis]